MSFCRLTILAFSPCVISQVWHIVILSPSNLAILPFSFNTILKAGHFIILRFSMMPFCYLAIWHACNFICIHAISSAYMQFHLHTCNFICIHAISSAYICIQANFICIHLHTSNFICIHAISSANIQFHLHTFFNFPLSPLAVYE
jgi:hypothetical protein